jgi:murein hydrolase activator
MTEKTLVIPLVIKQLFQLILIAGFSLALPALAQTVSEAEYQAKLKTLQRNISELQQELNAVKGNRDQLLRELKNNETATGELLNKIEKIKRQLKAEEQALQSLHRKRTLLTEEQSAEKKQVAQQVRVAYRLGGQSNLKLLLNQNNPETVSRLLKYHDYFLAAHGNKIAAYVETLNQLKQIEPQILQNTQSLQYNRSQLQTRFQQLRSKQTEREKMLVRLNETIKSKDQELQKLASDRQHIEKLMTEIVATVGNQATFNNNAPFAALRGKLPWPASGKIAHSFGSERIAGKMQWDGVVIRATEGSPVKAIHHGRVVFADYLRGHGLLIIVDHGEGYMSLYAHNQTLKKTAGNWVEAGEVIAIVGSSGGQSQAGLYFEIRQHGQPTNPSGWCG